MHQERLVPIPEICNRLGIKTTKAFELLSRGDLPRIKLGASTRVRESDLNAYIALLAEQATNGR